MPATSEATGILFSLELFSPRVLAAQAANDPSLLATDTYYAPAP